MRSYLGPATSYARRRRARRPHAPAQGAAAQALLRRPRLRAVRPRSASCPSTTRRAPSGRSSRRTPTTIVARTRAVELVELGSGIASKTRVLLDAMARAGTLRALRAVSTSTAATCAPPPPRSRRVPRHVGRRRRRRLRARPRRRSPRRPARGSSRSSAARSATSRRAARRRFLRDLRDAARRRSHLLLGTDLVKDPRVLEAAYNDSAGVTAAVQPQRPARASTASSTPNFDSSSSST